MPGRLLDYEQSIEGQSVTVAALHTISLSKLNNKDPAEIERLREAASKTGFFYLDLRGDSEGDKVLKDLPAVYRVADEYFGQAEEVKVKDARTDIEPSQDLGFKSSDCDETFEISWDELGQKGVSHLPAPLKDQGKILQEFSAGCHGATHTMLNSLSPALAEQHRAGQPSDTGLKLIYEPTLDKVSDVGDNLHTDSGTFTLLFYDQWGLHGYLPDSQKWAFTPPQEGCALINVADSLQRLSGGTYHSPKHRVTQPIDGAAKRYYLSYFLRPETAVKKAWAAGQ